MSQYVNQHFHFYEPPYQKCGSCDQPAGIFQCPGCYRPYCTRHIEEHREKMRGDLKEIIQEHRQLWEKEPRDEPTRVDPSDLLKQIRDWKDRSILAIEQAADDAVKQVHRLLNVSKTKGHNTGHDKEHEKFQARLEQARNRDDFHETHLAVWQHTLEDIKNDLNTSPSTTANIQIDFSWESFIPKISVRQGLWVDGPSPGLSKPSANQGELRTGTYRFRFSTQDVFLGIISDNVEKRSEPWKTPTVYGWGGNNIVAINGTAHTGYEGYQSRLQPNDILSLRVDRTQRTIRLTNETTRDTYELEISTHNCPFPWQLNARCLKLIED